MIVRIAQQQHHHQKRYQLKLAGLLPMPLLSVGAVVWFGPWAVRGETRPGAGGGGSRVEAAGTAADAGAGGVEAAGAGFQGYQSSSRGRWVA